MGRPANVTPTFRLRKNRSGYYAVNWTEKGQTRTLSTKSKNRRAAESFFERFISLKTDYSPRPDNPPISEIMTGYYEDRKKAGKRAADDIFSCAKRLCFDLGQLQPQDILQNTIRRYAKIRTEEGVGNGSIIKELSYLRASLYWAEREGWIERAPKFQMPVLKPKPRDRWATREQVRQLLEACRSEHIRLFILIAVSTGARSGAIQELTWDRVDFERGLIDFGAGQGNKRRTLIPITRTLERELKLAARAATTDHVLEYRGRAVGTVAGAFVLTAKRAGLPWITPHVLRHTAATWMVMAGVDMRRAARYLGMSEKIFEGVYGKHSPNYLRDAAEALELENGSQTSYLKEV